MAKAESFVRQVARVYLRRLRTTLLACFILLLAGGILLAIYYRNPQHSSAAVALNIGSALLTGALFALILPIFLIGLEPAAGEVGGRLSHLFGNYFLGIGRVWPSEATFSAGFDVAQALREHSDGERVFVGFTLARVFEAYGHIIETAYVTTPRSKWKPCIFVVSDPSSEYVDAHVASAFGRKATADEIIKSIARYAELRESISKRTSTAVDEIPLRLLLTKTPMRFGLIAVREDFYILTLYRYGSRSYFNPRIEIMYWLDETAEPSALGRWIEGYVADVLKASTVLTP